MSAVSTWRWSLAEDLAFWAEAGIGRVGLSFRKLREAGLPASVRRVAEAGLDVESLGEIGWFDLARPEKWPRHRDRLRAALDAASAVGARSIVLLSGPAGGHTWEQAADALEEAITPVLDDARKRSVSIALENTNSLRVDYSFVHTLRDALDLAGRLGVGVCAELNACWAERGLDDAIARGSGTIRLAQVSDFVVGSTTSPDRAALGDGDIPFPRILGRLLSAGYGGAFELELVGPRIEEQGYASALRRSIAYLEPLLASLVAGGR